jgi:hypothetical protein
MMLSWLTRTREFITVNNPALKEIARAEEAASRRWTRLNSAYDLLRDLQQ